MGTSHSVDLMIDNKFQETAFSLRKDARLLKTIDNDLYGAGQLIIFADSPSTQPTLLKQRLFSSSTSFEYFIELPKKRKALNMPNLIPMIDMFVCKQSDLLSAFYKVYMTYDYYETSLKDLIDDRIHTKTPFSSQDTIQMLDQILSALLFLCDNGIAHRFIRSSSIAISDKSSSSITYLLSDAGFIHNNDGDSLLRALYGDRQNCYLSPEEFESLRLASLPTYKSPSTQQQEHLKAREDEEIQRNFTNTKTQAIFSLAIIAVEMATAKSANDLYDFDRFCINKTRLMNRLECIASTHSPELAFTLACMLHFTPQKRITAENALLKLKGLQLQSSSTNRNFNFDPRMILSTSYSFHESEEDMNASDTYREQEHAQVKRIRNLSKQETSQIIEFKSNNQWNTSLSEPVIPQNKQYYFSISSQNLQTTSSQNTIQKSVRFSPEVQLPITTDFYLSPPKSSSLSSKNTFKTTNSTIPFNQNTISDTNRQQQQQQFFHMVNNKNNQSKNNNDQNALNSSYESISFKIPPVSQRLKAISTHLSSSKSKNEKKIASKHEVSLLKTTQQQLNKPNHRLSTLQVDKIAKDSTHVVQTSPGREMDISNEYSDRKQNRITVPFLMRSSSPKNNYPTVSTQIHNNTGKCECQSLATLPPRIPAAEEKELEQNRNKGTQQLKYIQSTFNGGITSQYPNTTSFETSSSKIRTLSDDPTLPSHLASPPQQLLKDVFASPFQTYLSEIQTHANESSTFPKYQDNETYRQDKNSISISSPSRLNPSTQIQSVAFHNMSPPKVNEIAGASTNSHMNSQDASAIGLQILSQITEPQKQQLQNLIGEISMQYQASQQDNTIDKFSSPSTKPREAISQTTLSNIQKGLNKNRQDVSTSPSTNHLNRSQKYNQLQYQKTMLSNQKQGSLSPTHSENKLKLMMISNIHNINEESKLLQPAQNRYKYTDNFVLDKKYINSPPTLLNNKKQYGFMTERSDEQQQKLAQSSKQELEQSQIKSGVITSNVEDGNSVKEQKFQELPLSAAQRQGWKDDQSQQLSQRRNENDQFQVQRQMDLLERKMQYFDALLTQQRCKTTLILKDVKRKKK